MNKLFIYTKTVLGTNVLTLILFLFVLPMVGQNTVVVEHFTYTLHEDGTTCTLSKVPNSKLTNNKNIVIPETIVDTEGNIFTVTGIGGSECFNNQIKHISIAFPKGLKNCDVNMWNSNKVETMIFRCPNYESVSSSLVQTLFFGFPVKNIYIDVEGTELPGEPLLTGLKNSCGTSINNVTVYIPIGTGSSDMATAYREAGFAAVVEKDMRPDSININSEEGWGTFYSDNYIKMPNGLTGYIVSKVTDGVLTMVEFYPAGSIVPAGTGILVRGSKGKHIYENIDDATLKASAQTPASNLLRGTYRRKAAIADTEGTESDYRFYKLSYSGGTNLGFYWGGNDGISFVNGEQKAYLMLPRTAAMANVKGFAFREAVVSGIEHVETVTPADNLSTEIYTIDGRRATQPLASGIYIKGRKKFYVK